MVATITPHVCPVACLYVPTAVQVVGPEQETEKKPPRSAVPVAALAGRGTVTRFQLPAE